MGCVFETSYSNGVFFFFDICLFLFFFKDIMSLVSFDYVLVVQKTPEFPLRFYSVPIAEIALDEKKNLDLKIHWEDLVFMNGKETCDFYGCNAYSESRSNKREEAKHKIRFEKDAALQVWMRLPWPKNCCPWVNWTESKWLTFETKFLEGVFTMEEINFYNSMMEKWNKYKLDDDFQLPFQFSSGACHGIFQINY